MTSLGDTLAAVTDAAGRDRRRRPVPEPAEVAESRNRVARGGRVLGHAESRTPCSPCSSAAPPCRPRPGRTAALAAANFNENAPTAPGTANGLGPAPAAAPGPRRRGAAARTGRRDGGPPRSHAPQPRAWGPAAVSEAVDAASHALRRDRLDGTAPPGSRPDRKQRLQAVVDETLLAPAAEQAATYRALLRAAVPEELLSDARLRTFEPGQLPRPGRRVSRRILAAYPEYTGRPARLAHHIQNGASRG